MVGPLRRVCSDDGRTIETSVLRMVGPLRRVCSGTCDGRTIETSVLRDVRW